MYTSQYKRPEEDRFQRTLYAIKSTLEREIDPPGEANTEVKLRGDSSELSICGQVKLIAEVPRVHRSIHQALSNEISD